MSQNRSFIIANHLLLPNDGYDSDNDDVLLLSVTKLEDYLSSESNISKQGCIDLCIDAEGKSVKHTGSHETSLPKRICIRKLHGAAVYDKTYQSSWEDK